MIFGITNFSPLDVDTLLAGMSRTLNPNEKAEYFVAFSYTDKFKSKNCILFNSLEYCQKRSNVVILDSEGAAIDNVVARLKAK